MTTVKIVNRGTGAGGGNTNKNGLSYEEITDLLTEFETVGTKNSCNIIQFNGSDIKFVHACKSNTHKFMNSINEKNLDLNPAAGCKSPDEAYINEDNKIIFIIEKKFQQGSGSVDEKIQTGDFKKKHYSQLFPNFKVEYIYCLSDWFKNGYSSELSYLKENNIQIFWGSDDDYKSKIITFMTCYE